METTVVLENAGAAITALLGLMGLVRPSAAAAFTSLEPKGRIGISEIRATYGGFFLALGLCALWLQEPLAFQIVGLAWIGAAGGRLLSVIVDASRERKNLGGIVFEAGMGALLLV